MTVENKIGKIFLRNPNARDEISAKFDKEGIEITGFKTGVEYVIIYKPDSISIVRDTNVRV